MRSTSSNIAARNQQYSISNNTDPVLNPIRTTSPRAHEFLAQKRSPLYMRTEPDYQEADENIPNRLSVPTQNSYYIKNSSSNLSEHPEYPGYHGKSLTSLPKIFDVSELMGSLKHDSFRQALPDITNRNLSQSVSTSGNLNQSLYRHSEEPKAAAAAKYLNKLKNRNHYRRKTSKGRDPNLGVNLLSDLTSRMAKAENFQAGTRQRHTTKLPMRYQPQKNDENYYSYSSFQTVPTSKPSLVIDSLQDVQTTAASTAMLTEGTLQSSPNEPQKRYSVVSITSLENTELGEELEYEGETKDGLRHGKGKIYYVDGRLLEANFEDGCLEGSGILYYSNGSLCYDGNFRDNKFHGDGRYYNYNPEVLDHPYDYTDFGQVDKYWILYVGDFKNGKKNGIGQLYLSNGEKYYGEFKDDKIEGKGCYYLKGKLNGIAAEWKDSKLVVQF